MATRLTNWLAGGPLRVGLGCMRLSTDALRDEARARATFMAALDAGISLFDTAHAYGHDETEYGHNERWLAQALAAAPRGGDVLLVTKGGMRRQGARWLPDGRASTLEAQCEASLAALGGRPIDVYLVHAPDPRTPWKTTLAALRRLRDDGRVRAVGVSNVNRAQLDMAVGEAGVEVLQQGVSLVDDEALRSGVVARALDLGLLVMCHSPLGGPKRVGTLRGQAWLRAAAEARGESLEQWALAALLALSPNVAVIPGARTPQAARSAAAAARVVLPEAVAQVLGERLRPPSAATSGVATPSVATPDAPTPLLATRLVPAAGDGTPRTQTPPDATAGGAEVVLLMGLQGSGKTARAQALVAAGYERLNRDDAGGTLAQLHLELSRRLARGVRRVVLDNTYVTRAQRAEALHVAAKAGLPTRGVWHEATLEQAQLNVTARMLSVHRALLSPEHLRRGKTPDTLGPAALLRTARTVERPEAQEGFSALETVSFVARPPQGRRPATFIGLDTLEQIAAAQREGHLVVLVGWSEASLTTSADVVLVCPHGGGPPACWCRPPLPGLFLAAAALHDVDLERSVLRTSGEALLRAASLAGVGRSNLISDVVSE